MDENNHYEPPQILPPTQEEEERDNKKIAWAFSVVFHILLIVIFALVNTGWRYDVPEWVEMEFMSVKKTPPKRSTPRKQPQRAPVRKPEPKPQKEEVAKVEKPVEQPPKKNIVLPKRRTWTEEQEVIQKKRNLDFSANDVAASPIERKDSGAKQEFDVPQINDDLFAKEETSLNDVPTSGKDVALDVPDLGREIATPFKIEGEASNRSVLYKVVPEHPGSGQRESVVKISFVVLPSGVVARAVPMIKGDAMLERVALEAFRKWRFNTLPATAEQRNQQGVITFRFVMK